MSNTTAIKSKEDSAKKRASRLFVALYVPGVLSLLMAWGNLSAHRVDHSMILWDMVLAMGFAGVAFACFGYVFHRSRGWSRVMDVLFAVLAAVAGILAVVKMMMIVA